VGGLVGCGLLGAAVALGIMVVSNYLSAADTPVPTATIPTEGPTAVSGPPSATPVFVGATPVERTPEGPGVGGTLGPDTQPTPTFPPDFDATSGLILYFARTDAGTFALFELDLESGEYVQLTTEDYNSSYPQMSPDGRWLAYQSDQDGDFEIFLMELATGETRQLTDNAVLDRIPSWSPDSQWIIYSSDTRNDGNLDLYRIGVDGGQPQLIYSDGKRNSHARFSHDGRHLVFTSGNNADARTWEIVRLDLGTGESQQLTDNDVRDANPSFSPDDQTVLYNTNGEGGAAIAVMPADGSGAPQIIYDGLGSEWGMHYSPDGAFILFNSEIEEHSTLYLMHADGSDLRAIETGKASFYPSWMP
jgi:Tol biopolymer transport system component